MIENIFRKRTYFLVGGSLLVILYLYLTDPNDGAITTAFLGQLVSPIIAVWFAYLVRKALFDYLDMEEIFKKAAETSIGSAISFLAICLVFFGLLGLFGPSARAQDVTTYIPSKSAIYLPIVKQELNNTWGNHPKKLS